MNRNIKFRAWDKGTKKWLLGYEYPNLGGFSLFGECMLFGEWGHILNDYILNYEDHNHSEGDLVVMQFIEKHDKEGVEIYGDDIVKIPEGYGVGGVLYNSFIGKIEYDAPGFYVNQSDNIKKTGKWSGQEYQWDEVEVIGNIHQNPELL